MKTWQPAFALLLFFFSTTASAQQYIFQEDDPILKKKYYDQSLKKKQSTISSLPKENTSDYKKIYEEQFETISELLRSSRSVTAPEAHNYLQSVLRTIIDANKELKDLELRVVFSRDWWPNAYSMGDGTIAINAGLMIYLDNEAELVFILCHELAHYYLDHSGRSIKKYVTTVNSEEFQNELKRLSKQEYRVAQAFEKLLKDVTFSNRLHSRNNEAEADLQAFNFMKRTGYDCNAIKSTLELLNVIDDTLLYKPLDVQQSLSFTNYPFKKKWIQKESSIFSQMNESDTPITQKEKDTLKTHPDCSKRILLLNDSLQKHYSGGKKFLINEPIFRKLKKDFYLEMTEQCHNGDNLSRNLYYSLLSLQEKEYTSFAVYSVARCLNEIYENQKNHTLGKKLDTENRNYPADYNELLRMLNRLKLDEIAAINLNFCKLYYPEMKDYPGFDKEVEKITKRIN